MQVAEKISEFRKKHEAKLEVAFFVGGFVFDAWMVKAPDEIFSMLQQAAYLFFIAALIHYELLFRLQKWRPGSAVLKVWPYRNLALHFFLGTLLNVYSIFYIKSASIFSSFIFLLLMIAMILGNELPAIKKSNVSMKVALYSICLFSYLSIIFPILFGFVGYLPFMCAALTTLVLFYIQLKIIRRRVQDEKILLRALLAPCFSVLFVFGLFYALGWIPPVPLSVKEQGVYHLIEKKNGNFLLSTEKDWWKFWQQADSDFRAQPEDKIYFYAQIYSPARISDQVYIHWFEKDARGNWMSSDRIPLKIQGGREEGYRGFAYKSNYQPGHWKVLVETNSGIEISRAYFSVESEGAGTPREFRVLTR